MKCFFICIFRYGVPALQAVGWEGTFGFLTLATLLIPFYFIPAGKFGHNPRGVLEDAYDGLFQWAHNWRLGKPLILINYRHGPFVPTHSK